MTYIALDVFFVYKPRPRKILSRQALDLVSPLPLLDVLFNITTERNISGRTNAIGLDPAESRLGIEDGGDIKSTLQ